MVASRIPSLIEGFHYTRQSEDWADISKQCISWSTQSQRVRPDITKLYCIGSTAEDLRPMVVVYRSMVCEKDIKLQAAVARVQYFSPAIILQMGVDSSPLLYPLLPLATGHYENNSLRAVFPLLTGFETPKISGKEGHFEGMAHKRRCSFNLL